MTEEQKERANGLLSAWRATAYALHACRMAELLQELVDAPEVLPATNPSQISSLAEPVAWMYEDNFGTHFTEDYSKFPNNPGILSFTPLYGGAQPAPSVPDGWIRAVDEAMVVHHIGIADRADSYEVAKKKLNALLVINSDIERYFSEPPADVARDAALYCAVQRACAELPEGWEIRIELERSAGTVSLVNPDGEDVDYPSDHEYMALDINDAIDAARERQGVSDDQMETCSG
jgi:hypothetical protein